MSFDGLKVAPITVHVQCRSFCLGDLSAVNHDSYGTLEPISVSSHPFVIMFLCKESIFTFLKVMDTYVKIKQSRGWLSPNSPEVIIVQHHLDKPV